MNETAIVEAIEEPVLEAKLVEEKTISVYDVITDFKSSINNKTLWRTYYKEKMNFYETVKECIQDYKDNIEVDDEDVKIVVDEELKDITDKLIKSKISYEKFNFYIECCEQKLKYLKEKYDIQE